MSTRHLVALDLDGTVLANVAGHAGDGDESSLIDPRVREMVQQLEARGDLVVISTGRSVDATLPIVEALGISPEWVVSCNGAVTLKRDALAPGGYRREVVETFRPKEALIRIRQSLPEARFAVEVPDGGFLFTDPIPSGTLPSGQKQVPFEELIEIEATRVVVVSPDQDAEEFLDAVSDLGLTHVSYAVGRTSWLDIAPNGVTKASALEHVREHNQISPEDVLAAGDGRNDIDMLQWAGQHGVAVAMGQAVEEVHAAATTITGDVDAGGLYDALAARFPELS